MAPATPGCAEHDFAEMERRGVSFIRSGVWNTHTEVFDGDTGQVKERFLRDVEAFLLSAARNRIHVNFTFCAFDPQTIMRRPGEDRFSLVRGPILIPILSPSTRDWNICFPSCGTSRTCRILDGT